MSASIESVSVVGMPYTQLGADGDAERVVSVEHLLAALEACGVDNARVEIEGGPEVPLLDGSALGWCLNIQQAGLRPATAPGSDAHVPRLVFVPSASVVVRVFLLLLLVVCLFCRAGLSGCWLLSGHPNRALTPHTSRKKNEGV